ncbi:MAG: S-layer protein domain-containing protein, partial [Euryarchaeota archaeon]|nr:S-layer protein domain-containing protein [Euryarchaeota archaeon]
NGHDGYTINGNDNNFLYNTSIYDKNGEPFIAWLGKQFCVIDNGVDWNISKVLADENEDDTHLIEVGKSLNLPEGFAITPLEINDDGINTRISITQNGDEVYNVTINESELFIYEEDLNASGIKDNWVLKFNVETVFKGINSELININKTQLISPDVLTIRTPDTDLIPTYEITSQDFDMTLQIKLDHSSDFIQLYKGSTVSFLDNSFHFRISEDGDLGGLAVVIEEPGTYEIFSKCHELPANTFVPFDLTSALDPSILYYDFDEGDGDEVLNFNVDVDKNQIKGIDNFLYETSIYDKDGKDFIAWLGEPYFVVSNEGSDWYLSELLIDEDKDDTRLLEIGKTLTFEEEGLALTPLEVDVDGDEVWFTLTRDGEEVDSSVVKEGSVYKYEEDLNESGDEDNTVLKFIVETVYIDSFVKINSTQLVSTDIVKVETPDSDLFDDFEVTTVNDQTLQIKFDKDDDNITLTKGDTTSFLNDTFHFRTNEDGDIGGIYTTIKVEKAWRDVTESLYTDTNTVCGNVTTLSEFIIAVDNILPEDTNGNGGSSSGGGNTQQGTNVNVQFEDEGINITFAEVTKSGDTSVDTSSTGPDIPDGYDRVGEYRNITTTAKYTGNTSVCINYSDTKMVDESALKLFHYETGENEPIVVYVQTGINAVDSTWDLSSPTHPSLLYYDFEEGEGCENLHFVINGHDDYTINGSDNNFLYNTSIYDKNGEPFIAWLGKQFCVIDNGVDWNISKVLTDENEYDTHLIEVGESLSLPEGFAITPLEINDDGINTRISITQNGDEVYNLTINESELFIYEEDLNANGIKDNWVLKFNVEEVSKGEYDSEIVKINKIQLISPDVVTIRTPDSDLIPNYIITSQDSDETLQIKLDQPNDIIQLYKGSTVSFLDNSFHIRISKDGDLVGLAVVIEEPGTYEIFSECKELPTGIGAMVPFDLTSPFNPSILYYDFDKGDGAEVLNFTVDVDNKQIKGHDNFLYQTSIYDKDGKDFIAWLGEPYFVVGTGSDWYLSELLIDEDEDDTHLLEIGQTLTFEEEGLALTPVEIDVDGEEVWFTLTKDGEEVDSSVVKEGNVYKYEEDLNESGYEDNTVLKFIVETVFAGNNTNFVKINSTQLVSTDIVKVETPDSELFDDFEVTTVGDDTLRITFDKDDDKITLKKDGMVNFLDRFNFRINEDGNIGGIYTTIKVEKPWRDVTKSLDTDTNTVCGNVTTLSEFIIAVDNILPEDTNGNGGSSSGGGNTQQGTNINVQFEDEGINITFAEVTKSGNTSVDTSLTGPDLPDGYDLVGEYRNITTTAKYAGNTSVCIDYSDTKIIDESALKLFHYETGENGSIVVYVQTGINAVDSTWDLFSPIHPSLLYFDFEEGDGCENLHFVINGHDGYTINGSDNNFLYNTSIYDKNGEPFIAWLGKQFCVIDNGVDWNISKVLADENEDDPHLIKVGESLSLPEGFAITPLEINDDGTNTRISITQNGDEVYNVTINEHELFVYEEDLNASGIKDNWVLRFNVEAVFKGEYDSEIVKINKTQLISPDVMTIRTPDSDLISNYIITSQDSDKTLQIKLNQPGDIIQLYKGSTVSFLDNSFHIRISEDGNVGGFVVVIEEPGTYELFSECKELPTGIGAMVPFDLTSAFNPSILYYDFDKGDGAEVLNFTVDVDNKQIKGHDNFLYQTSIYDKDGKDFIAWLGEPYFVVGTGSDWYLSELLIDEDEDDTHLLEIGQTLTFEEEGLALTPVEIDVDDEEVWFTLTKDGEEVNSSVVKEGSVYKYKQDLNESGNEDNWVLKFRVETVFAGNNTNFVKINSTQLVSTDIVKVETPDSDLFDDFEVTTVNDQTLQIKFDK